MKVQKQDKEEEERRYLVFSWEDPRVFQISVKVSKSDTSEQRGERIKKALESAKEITPKIQLRTAEAIYESDDWGETWKCWLREGRKLYLTSRQLNWYELLKVVRDEYDEVWIGFLDDDGTTLGQGSVIMDEIDHDYHELALSIALRKRCRFP